MTLRFPRLADELRHRLLLAPDAFDAFLADYLAALPPRPCGPEQVAYALDYPWARPAASYTLVDGAVRDPDPSLAAGRHPILAFGSNAAPSVLQRKFAHFADPGDRTVLVTAGDLHDFDVGAAASAAMAYGAMPATLFPSPGTRVRAALVHATDAQAEQLTWSELTYALGRLEVTFDGAPTEVLAYVCRYGTFAPDGESVALAAVPAQDRTAPARTQRELLDLVGRLTGLGDAEDVVRSVHERPAALMEAVRDHIRPLGRPFSSGRWTPYAG